MQIAFYQVYPTPHQSELVLRRVAVGAGVAGGQTRTAQTPLSVYSRYVCFPAAEEEATTRSATVSRLRYAP